MALGADIPRVGGPAQDAYRAQVDRYLDHVQKLIDDEDDEAATNAPADAQLAFEFV